MAQQCHAFQLPSGCWVLGSPLLAVPVVPGFRPGTGEVGAHLPNIIIIQVTSFAPSTADLQVWSLFSSVTHAHLDQAKGCPSFHAMYLVAIWRMGNPF